jgi:uncharacterized protein YndB with AHSA1/START domain
MTTGTTHTAAVTTPSDTQILITREFDAPARLVFQVYTTPELVKRWWAGNQGELTVAEIDLRVGGRWRSAMTASDGAEVAFHGEYLEIVPNERIVSTEVFEGMPGNEYPDGDEQGTVNTATFTEIDGRTRLELLVDCPSKEVRDAILASGMEGGMQEGYDVLEQIAISLS